LLNILSWIPTTTWLNTSLWCF